MILRKPELEGKLTSAVFGSGGTSLPSTSNISSSSTASATSLISSFGVTLSGAVGDVGAVELPSPPLSFSSDSLSSLPFTDPSSESSIKLVSVADQNGRLTYQTLDAVKPYCALLDDYPNIQALRT
jgi:hypothetical protein